VSPQFVVDQTLFATVRGALFRSEKGGYDWHRLSRGLSCAQDLIALAISPEFARDHTLFVSCSSGGLYQSDDRGERWQRVDTQETSNAFWRIAISPHFESDQTLLALDSEGTLWRYNLLEKGWAQASPDSVGITALTWEANTLAAGTRDGAILVSENSGNSWKEFGRLSKPDLITVLLPPTYTDSTEPWFIGTQSSGLVRLDSEGLPMSEIVFPGEHITAVATDAGQLYLTTWDDAVFRSRDGGANWVQYGEALHRSAQADSFQAAHFSALTVAADGTVIGGGFCGLFISRDQGNNWDPLAVSLHQITGLAVSPGENGNYSIGLATYGGGVVISSDAGKSWYAQNVGLQTAQPGPLFFPPDYPDSDVILSGSYNLISRSNSRGSDWDSIELPPPYTLDRWRIKAQQRSTTSPTLKKILEMLRLDRQSDSIFPLGYHPSPDYRQDKTLYVTTHPGGLLKSLDGGHSFETLQGMDGVRLKSLLVGESSETGHRMLASTDDSLVQSTDGGATWKPLPPDKTPGSAQLTMSRAADGNPIVFAANQQGIYSSIDNGKTWEHRYQAPGDAGPIRSFVSSPDFHKDRLLLLQYAGGALHRCKAPVASPVNCEPVEGAPEFGHMISRERDSMIAFSPYYEKDGTIYATSMSHLMRSRNRGKSWQQVDLARRFEPEATLLQGMFVPLRLSGKWALRQGAKLSSSHAIQSTAVGSELSFKFYGSGIRWLGSHGPAGGRAQVYLNGQWVADVDQYDEKIRPLSSSFEVAALPTGVHSITIRILPGTLRQEMPAYIEIDALDVLP